MERTWPSSARSAPPGTTARWHRGSAPAAALACEADDGSRLERKPDAEGFQNRPCVFLVGSRAPHAGISHLIRAACLRARSEARHRNRA
jgi:hypothetical protein